MIHDYAIAPEFVAACTNRLEYLVLLSGFGLGTPRIMSEFPKASKWRGTVLRLAEPLKTTNEIAHARITALVSHLTMNTAKRSANYDGTKAWIENAEIEDARIPFHAILAEDNPSAHASVLRLNEIGDDSKLKWKASIGQTPNRTADDLASCLGPLLRISKELIIIDPYFNIEAGRFRRVFEKLLDTVFRARKGQILPSGISVFTSFKPASQYNFNRRVCDVADLVPIGLSVSISQLEEKGGELLHNRYVLSDVGGVKIEPGIDDDEGNGGQTYDVNVLGKEQYELRWGQYKGPTPAFNTISGPVVIGGNKVVSI